LTFPRN